jgi:glycosyltransferase involved in cell wall biosynthesis
MKILFLTDNFPPEVNAPATRTFEHCREWVKAGEEVTVITCAPNFPQGKVYDGYKNRLWQEEQFDGIRVIRVLSFITANEGFVKRTLDYISFGISSFLAGLFQAADVIVATSPQFFTAVSGRFLSKVKKQPWIMEVRDLWPESIKHVGALADSPVIRFLEHEELRCYRQAAGIVTVTDSFKRIITQRGIAESKFAVVKNGANFELFKPSIKNRELERKLGFEGKFVVGYIGTHGMAHKLDFIIETASKISDPAIHFLFIGDGAEKKAVIQMAVELKLSNVTFLDSVSKKEIADYISITDVALVPLKKTELFTTVIPSKIFENAAMRKPILLGVDGEARSIVEKYHAGLFFEPENEHDFISKLDMLSSDKTLYEACQKGCALLAQDFDRKKLAMDMLGFIRLIAHKT